MLICPVVAAPNFPSPLTKKLLRPTTTPKTFHPAWGTLKAFNVASACLRKIVQSPSEEFCINDGDFPRENGAGLSDFAIPGNNRVK